MSVHFSAASWKARIGDPIAKIVLLKLADNANDDGRCWPSVATLSAETELCERTIQAKIRVLEKMGALKADRGMNCCDYSLKMEIIKSLAQEMHPAGNAPYPAGDAPRRKCTLPRRKCTGGVQEMHRGGAGGAVASSEPSLNQREREERASSPRNESPPEWADTMPVETANDFAALQSRINNLHPSWKRRPHMTRIEQGELQANARIFFDLTDSDWNLLAAYMAAIIPEDWGLKSWQPDNRSRLIQGVTDVLGHADKWLRECKKRKIRTGMENVQTD